MTSEIETTEFQMRVDGDELVFQTPRMNTPNRYRLEWLVVRATPGRKNSMQVVIGQENKEQPVYGIVKKPYYPKGSSVIVPIDASEEPTYREFFVGIAEQCGRSPLIDQ